MGLLAVAGNSMTCKTYGGPSEAGWNCHICDKGGRLFAYITRKSDFSKPRAMAAILRRELVKFKHRKGCPASRDKRMIFVGRGG